MKSKARRYLAPKPRSEIPNANYEANLITEYINRHRIGESPHIDKYVSEFKAGNEKDASRFRETLSFALFMEGIISKTRRISPNLPEDVEGERKRALQALLRAPKGR